MAANKNTPKSAPTKEAAKPISKSAKTASKPTVKAEKEAAAPKKSAVVKKTAAGTKPVSAEKPAVAKKLVLADKKVESAPPIKKAAEVKIAANPVSSTKAPASSSRSTLVKTPVPAAPVKPPFVPPKAPAEPSGPILAPGSNGSHSPAFVQKQRQRLLDLRDDLVDSMSGMTRDTIRNAPEGSEASGSGQHQGDAGSDAYDRDFALSVLAKEQDALYEIEQALRRIQSGNYGICEMSSRKIPQARLEAIPFARLTVECQAQWEKEYGKRRFRPSNEVGFSGGNYMEDEESESVSLDEDED